MPLLRNNRWDENNPWIRVEDGEPFPENNTGKSPQLCSLPRFIELADQGSYPASGVWLTPEDDVSLLKPYLDHLQLVVVDFPAFTDGRGYSQARVLRTQLGFAGELRATGDVRVDQILFMVRSGIDTFDFPVKPDEQLIDNILSRFTVNYQPTYCLPIAG